jgi:hypothetical protein
LIHQNKKSSVFFRQASAGTDKITLLLILT